MDKVVPSAIDPPRLYSLDVLRGICAGVVFLSHWHLWSDFPPRGEIETFIRQIGNAFYVALRTLTWPTGGHHPAVLGFFVLSGFCIHYPFERRALRGSINASWPDYFRRRFLRIMPVYWAACLLGVLFVLAEKFHPTGSPLLALHGAASVEDVFVRFIAVAGIYPREIFAGNYILTTVTVEILMYAAYPLFHRYAIRGHWSELGLTFVALHVLAIAMLRYFTPYWVFNSVFMLGIFWYAGAFAAHLFLTGRSHVKGWWLIATWIGFLGLKATPHFTGLNLLKQGAWGLVCVLGILWAIQLEQCHPRFSYFRCVSRLRWLGAISYSLYAMHTPAIMLATWVLLLGGIHSYTVQLAATMTASVAVILVVHYGIERVFYRPTPEASRPLGLQNSQPASSHSAIV